MVQVKKDELNLMTPKILLRLKHQVQIQLPEQMDEGFLVVFLDICSATITYHSISADIYHEAFTYFVNEMERIMDVLDDEDAPIEEVCVESEE